MKFGDYIRQYREENDLSQRALGKESGLSHAMINAIEKGVNPNTGAPMEVSITTYRKLAIATGKTLDELFEILGPDAPVKLENSSDLSAEDCRLLNLPTVSHPNTYVTVYCVAM